MPPHSPCLLLISYRKLAEDLHFDERKALDEVFHIQTGPAHPRHWVGRTSEVEAMYLRNDRPQLATDGRHQWVHNAIKGVLQFLEPSLANATQAKQSTDINARSYNIVSTIRMLSLESV